MHAYKVAGVGLGALLVTVVIAGIGVGGESRERAHDSGPSYRWPALRMDPQALAETAQRLRVATLAVDRTAAQVMEANTEGVDPATRRAASADYLAAEARWREERRAFWAARRRF